MTEFKPESMVKLALISTVGALVALPVYADPQPVITSFANNGHLVCENLEPGTTAVIEWASNPAGPWKSDWTGLDGVVVDQDGKIAVNVPMFYRVRGTPRILLAIEPAAMDVTVYEDSSTNLQVRLNSQPPADVTVNVGSASVSKVAVSPPSLTFTTSDWATYKNISVTGVTDADAKDEVVAVSLSATGLTTKVVNATVLDTNQNINLTVNSIVIAEGGSGQLGVSLSGQPASNVQVTLVTQNANIATVSPTSMTFTPANWNVQQLATVYGTQNPSTTSQFTVLTATSGRHNPRTVNVVVNNSN